MPKREKIPASKVLPLFGSGAPLCWCGARAQPGVHTLGEQLWPTLCRAHRQSEEQLQAEAVARADAVLARHFDRAGHRREEGS